MKTVMITGETNLIEIINTYDPILASGYDRRTFFDYSFLDFEQVGETIDIYNDYKQWVATKTDKALMDFVMIPQLEGFKDVESNLRIII